MVKYVYDFVEGNKDLKDREHGVDPGSVHFFHEVGLDYVSCSPYRVPVARLEARRAALITTGSGSDSR